MAKCLKCSDSREQAGVQLFENIKERGDDEETAKRIKAYIVSKRRSI